VPNPFSLIDRLELDFELPPVPRAIERADRWFDRLSEIQRIGVGLLAMLFLAASALYCLGLGSTVLVNRAEAALAAQEAELAASLPTVEPTAMQPEPSPSPLAVATAAPTPQPTLRPTQITVYPTPIPAQLLPTVPLQPVVPRSAAPPAEAPRPRIVAPYEPPTPTPPVRTAPAAPRGTTSSGSSTTGPNGAPARSSTQQTPSFSAPGAKPTLPPAQSTVVARPTTAPAAKPAQPAGPSTGAPKPTQGPIIQNPFPATPGTKPGLVATPKPGAR
jgi:hypothetical protein